MTRLTTILTLLTLLSSCTANYFITVRPDRSASVQFDKGLEQSEMDKLAKSDMISNLDTSSNEISFDISDIDSLGKYLAYHPEIFQFRMDEQELTIKSKSVPNEWCECHLYMQIQLDQKIEEIAPSSGQVKKKDDKTIIISKSKRKLTQGEEKMDVTVKIKKTGGNKK